jgi:hypothetical protein
MDPISVVVTALAAGAAAGVRPAAEQAVKDAYAGLKAFIQRKWREISLDPLEANPASKARQGMVKEDLEQVGAAKDPDLVMLAERVLEAVVRHAPETARGLGVRLEGITAGGSLRIKDVTANDLGVEARKINAQGDIEISGVHAGGTARPLPPRVRQ